MIRYTGDEYSQWQPTWSYSTYRLGNGRYRYSLFWPGNRDTLAAYEESSRSYKWEWLAQFCGSLAASRKASPWKDIT